LTFATLSNKYRICIESIKTWEVYKFNHDNGTTNAKKIPIRNAAQKEIIH
jgi:hypothetical protein